MEITLEKFKKNPLLERIKELVTSTKNLAFQPISKGSVKRKLVVSTNLLAAFHWPSGTSVVEHVIGTGKGLHIRRAILGESKTKKVYERSYKNRGGQKETLLDIRHQSKIADAFLNAPRAHIVITKDAITITPMFDASSLQSKAGTIEIPDIKLMADAIISVLDTIKEHKLTHIEFHTVSDFWETDVALLLTTQLKRLGYKLEQTNAVFHRATTHNNAELSYNAVELSKPSLAQVPPRRTNAKLQAFVAFSGGFDAHLLEQDGFTVVAGQEWAPVEKRDTSDKTELYAHSLMMNTHLELLSLYPPIYG